MSPQKTRQVTYVLAIALIAYLDYRILESFLDPLTWAAVLAIFFWPVHRRIAARIRNANLATTISVLVVTVVLIGPAVTVGAAFVREGLIVLRSVPTSEIIPKLQGLADQMTARLPVATPEITGRLGDLAQAAGAFIAKHTAGAAGGFAQFFFHLSVMVFGLFYLFRDGPALVQFLRDTAPVDSATSDRITGEVREMVAVTLQSTVIVALAQGLCAGLIFWMLGLPAPVFWGVVSGVLAFLPIVGPSLVWIGASIVLLASGETWRGVAMVLLGAFVISGVDNVLRPILISGKAKLNGFFALLSVLGGIYAFGFLGMVLGPLLIAVTIGMLRGYRSSLTEPAGGAGAAPPDAETAS